MDKNRKKEIKDFITNINSEEFYDVAELIRKELDKMESKLPTKYNYYVLEKSLTSEELKNLSENKDFCENIEWLSFDEYDEEPIETFIQINGDMYYFTASPGDCIEARWDGNIYATNYSKLKLVPKKELKNYVLVKGEVLGFEDYFEDYV